MKVLLSLLTLTLFSSCVSGGLANTCSRFGMVTDHVLVKAIDSETLGESKTVTQFKCVPKKYKEK